MSQMTVREAAKPTTRHPLTVEIYTQMVEAGILGEDARVELLNGELFDMSPTGSRHAAVVDRLNFLLGRLVRPNAIVRVQSPIQLTTISLPEPDIALLRARDDFYADAHPGPADVLLLVEVSDSSLAYDTERKLPAYAAEGVPEVWIVNLNDDCIDRHLTPTPAGYRLRERFLPDDALTSSALADHSLQVRDILGLKDQKQTSA
jgi:Uma2 family endonuclease